MAAGADGVGLQGCGSIRKSGPYLKIESTLDVVFYEIFITATIGAAVTFNGIWSYPRRVVVVCEKSEHLPW